MREGRIYNIPKSFSVVSGNAKHIEDHQDTSFCIIDVLCYQHLIVYKYGSWLVLQGMQDWVCVGQFSIEAAVLVVKSI